MKLIVYLLAFDFSVKKPLKMHDFCGNNQLRVGSSRLCNMLPVIDFIKRRPTAILPRLLIYISDGTVICILAAIVAPSVADAGPEDTYTYRQY